MSSDREQQSKDESESGGIPPIDFNTFVLSLVTSAIAHLDQEPKEDETQAAKLAMARQTIDVLGILEEKTRGNLTGEEERLLSQVLTDLRMRYVAVADQ